MAKEVTISKCKATYTTLIVYFSGPIDESERSDPREPENYTVSVLGKVPMHPDGVDYDAEKQAAVLRLPENWSGNDAYGLKVDNLKTNGKEIKELSFISGATKPSDDKVDSETLKKILQPSYAIGVGIITQDDYNSLKNNYFAQSELSVGLIIPLILIVLGLALAPQIGIRPIGLPIVLESQGRTMEDWASSLAWFLTCAALAPLCTVLFLIGTERYQKFRMELKLLILGNWKKQLNAKKAASNGTSTSGTSAKTVSPSGGGGGKTKIELSPFTVNINAKSEGSEPSRSEPLESGPEPGATKTADESPAKATSGMTGKHRMPSGDFDLEERQE